jgi:hypothetical protein
LKTFNEKAADNGDAPDLMPRWCFGLSQAPTSVKIKLYLLLHQSEVGSKDVVLDPALASMGMWPERFQLTNCPVSARQSPFPAVKVIENSATRSTLQQNSDQDR